MLIGVIDNVQSNTASMLSSAIKMAKDVRIAVAFVSCDGLRQIMSSIQTALEGGAYVEFSSLLCFASQNTSAIYHPKMYLARDNHTATVIIGSSSLT